MPQASQNALLTTDDLARDLKLLAAEPRMALRRRELRALAHDLEHGTHLDQWAEVDLVRSFVRPESLAPAPAPGAQHGPLRSLAGYLAKPPRDRSVKSLARWLRGGLRNRPVRSGALEAVMGVLVFIPLLVTWIGLREAVVAYGALAREKGKSKEATRPFLQLWQSGFDGHLAGVGRFENVAMTTVIFIVLLVLLSLWHVRVRGRTERDEAAREGADEHLLGRLAALLTQTQFALVQHRSAAPQQFARELTKSARQLADLTSRAERSHQVLTSTGNALKQAADTIKTAASGLTAEIPKLGAAAGQLETSVRSGQEAIERAGKENVTAAQKVADRIAAAGTTVESALGSLAATQQTLVAKSEAVAQASERASQALLESTTHTTEALKEMREATEQWDAAAAHWQNAAAQVEARTRGTEPGHTYPDRPEDGPSGPGDGLPGPGDGLRRPGDGPLGPGGWPAPAHSGAPEPQPWSGPTETSIPVPGPRPVAPESGGPRPRTGTWSTFAPADGDRDGAGSGDIEDRATTRFPPRPSSQPPGPVDPRAEGGHR